VVGQSRCFANWAAQQHRPTKTKSRSGEIRSGLFYENKLRPRAQAGKVGEEKVIQETPQTVK
jgi:hypothetical protein